MLKRCFLELDNTKVFLSIFSGAGENLENTMSAFKQLSLKLKMLSKVNGAHLQFVYK